MSPRWGTVNRMSKRPEYATIADTLRTELLAGAFDDEPLPGNGALAERFEVNMKTAARAIQQLVAEGLVLARPGMRAVAVPAAMRDERWPMTGRYARARAAQGLLFASDVPGDMRKDTIVREWIDAPIRIAQILNVSAGARIFHRRSRTYVNDVPTEDTSLYFPEPVVRAAPGLETDERIQVVRLIEAAGYTVTRTANEIRSRHPIPAEQQTFGLDATAIVVEHTHGTYGAENEALEAVINVRPAKGNVITFDTYEAPVTTDKEMA